MANYDCFCGSCSLLKELNIPIADYDKVIKCPKCGKQMVRVILKAAPFRVRGGTRGSGLH